jgi:hypothetical protein
VVAKTSAGEAEVKIDTAIEKSTVKAAITPSLAGAVFKK